MKIKIAVTVEVDEKSYSKQKGIPVSQVPENVASELERMGDALTWHVVTFELSCVYPKEFSDVVEMILKRKQRGPGGGIPLTRGEVAMLFMDGYAGDGPGLLDIRSQGYGDDNDWDGLTYDDVLDNTDEQPGEAAFVWTKWEPFELWHLAS